MSATALSWPECSKEITAVWPELSPESRDVILRTALSTTVKAISAATPSGDGGGVPLPERITLFCPELSEERLAAFLEGNKLLDWMERPEAAQAHDTAFLTARLQSVFGRVEEAQLAPLVAMRALYLSTFISELLFVVASALGGMQAAVKAAEPPAPVDPLLDPATTLPDPFAQFGKWFEEARAAGFVPRYGMPISLATSTPDGFPSARIVLLKSFSDAGFLFFTNYESRKGRELVANPRAAIIVFWPDMFGGRQVRIEGRVEKVSEADSDEYFHSRPESARVGCWASPQSTEIPSRQFLVDRVASFTSSFTDAATGAVTVPRPSHWGGFRVVPHMVEFWRGGGDSRLHDRVVYTLAEGGVWSKSRLAP